MKDYCNPCLVSSAAEKGTFGGEDRKLVVEFTSGELVMSLFLIWVGFGWGESVEPATSRSWASPQETSDTQADIAQATVKMEKYNKNRVEANKPVCGLEQRWIAGMSKSADLKRVPRYPGPGAVSCNAKCRVHYYIPKDFKKIKSRNDNCFASRVIANSAIVWSLMSDAQSGGKFFDNVVSGAGGVGELKL